MLLLLLLLLLLKLDVKLELLLLLLLLLKLLVLLLPMCHHAALQLPLRRPQLLQLRAAAQIHSHYPVQNIIPSPPCHLSLNCCATSPPSPPLLSQAR